MPKETWRNGMWGGKPEGMLSAGMKPATTQRRRIRQAGVCRAAVLLIASVLTVAGAVAQTANGGKALTVEDIFAHGPIIGQEPEGLTWSPDGKHLTYMDAEGLMEIDLVTGKPRVLVGVRQLQALSGGKANEQAADHRNRYHQAAYLWTPDGKKLLFDADGVFWLFDPATKQAVKVASAGEASEDSPTFAPNGRSLAFVSQHGLAVVALPGADGAAASPRMLTPGASATLLEGQVDWVYEEELGVRSNLFWSPDSSRIAYLEMDETKVPEYPIEDWLPVHARVAMQRYPQPGDPNPAVRVGVVAANGGATVWVKLPVRPNEDYIPRFGWVDAQTLWVETLTRDHRQKTIWFANAATGEAKPVLAETDAKFFNDKSDIWVGAGHLVLTSWRDGHTQIYLYSYDPAQPMAGQARLERQLTQGNFEVTKVLGVDAARKLVYYQSNEGNWTERQIWQVSWSGEKKPLTTEPGVHDGRFAPSGGAFSDEHSTQTQTPTVSVCRAAGDCSVVWKTDALKGYPLIAPTTFTAKAADGTTLYATILLPAGKTDPASVPLIMNPYGGPGVMTVTNHWGGDKYLFDVVLAEHGFAVLHADGRGMGDRGRAFQQAAYHEFGPIQFQDQLAVADAALKLFPQLDARRQGWWGWSWGGSFTLWAMTHSDRFRVGVSVAPVTDWRNYDSIYTERYLGEPQQFPDVYKQFSVVNAAANLKGRLLLIHGTGDDNVHIENSIQFVQQMTVHNVPYSLNVYPRKTHSIAGTEVRPHLYNSILDHFEEYLMPIPSASTGAAAQ